MSTFFLAARNSDLGSASARPDSAEAAADGLGDGGLLADGAVAAPITALVAAAEFARPPLRRSELLADLLLRLHGGSRSEASAVLPEALASPETNRRGGASRNLGRPPPVSRQRSPPLNQDSAACAAASEVRISVEGGSSMSGAYSREPLSGSTVYHSSSSGVSISGRGPGSASQRRLLLKSVQVAPEIRPSQPTSTPTRESSE